LEEDGEFLRVIRVGASRSKLSCVVLDVVGKTMGFESVEKLQVGDLGCSVAAGVFLFWPWAWFVKLDVAVVS
jgi:hypothetical protein